MEYVKSNIPLWQVTIWDKKFNNVDKSWQPKVIKYRYIFSDRIEKIKRDYGDVVILYTGKNTGYTTKELAGEDLCNGEIVAIPWGGIPSVKYCKGNFVTGDNRIATSSNPNELDNKYLYYLLKSRINELSSYYRGASLKHPAMKNVLNMKISYPDIDRQKLIVKFLERIEEILTKQKRELFLLDTLIKARFVEMFGDPILNDKDWKISTFDDLTYLITDGEHSTPKRTNQGIYLLSARNILNHRLHLEDVDFIDKNEFERIAKRVFPQEGDVLLSCSGTVGRCCIVPKNFKFQMVRSVALLRFKVEINPLFAEYMITSDYLQRQIDKAKTSSSQANLFQGKIKTLKGIVPPIELQSQFSDFVQQVDKSKVAIQRSLEETQLLYDSLMQKYFG